MPAVLDAESTLTDRYQTTVPEPVRRALELNKRDKIHYSIRSNGEVVLSRARDLSEDDPVLEAFLAFLAHDLASHPERLVPVTEDLLASVKDAMHAAKALDLDAPLPDEDE